MSPTQLLIVLLLPTFLFGLVHCLLKKDTNVLYISGLTAFLQSIFYYGTWAFLDTLVSGAAAGSLTALAYVVIVMIPFSGLIFFPVSKGLFNKCASKRA